MTKKEYFKSKISCEKCNTTGTANWVENENPIHGNGLDTKLLDVSNDFEDVGENKIKCSKCGLIIN